MELAFSVPKPRCVKYQVSAAHQNGSVLPVRLYAFLLVLAVVMELLITAKCATMGIYSMAMDAMLAVVLLNDSVVMGLSILEKIVMLELGTRQAATSTARS